MSVSKIQGVTVGGGGAIEFVSKTTWSNQSNTGDIAISDSVKYKVVFNITSASNGSPKLALRFNSDSGTNYSDKGSAWFSTPDTLITITDAVMYNDSPFPCSAELIFIPVDTVGQLGVIVMVIGKVLYVNAAGNLAEYEVSGCYDGTVTSFEILNTESGGNEEFNGDVIVYQLNEA